MKRSLQTTLLAVLAALSVVSQAAADGLPVAVDASDNAGIALPDGAFSYATVSAGGDTAAVKIARGTGEITNAEELDGDYGVPLVAYDGTASGLSGDGSTLVLIRPRPAFPRERTRFTVLDTQGMQLREEIELDGDFSFDAISPDGRTMYLIHYLSRRDPTSYEVRAYDLTRGRLLAEPIVDPELAEAEMAGWPQTRAAGPGGRWAYTLYTSAHHHHPPFVHALDTQTGKALCIDLDPLAHAGGARISRLELEPSTDGSSLAVVDRREPVAEIDLESFEVGVPAAATASAEPAAADESSAVLGWPAIALGVVGLGFAGTMLARRRTRRPI